VKADWLSVETLRRPAARLQNGDGYVE
jgi:hypothetical protein